MSEEAIFDEGNVAVPQLQLLPLPSPHGAIDKALDEVSREAIEPLHEPGGVHREHFWLHACNEGHEAHGLYMLNDHARTLAFVVQLLWFRGRLKVRTHLPAHQAEAQPLKHIVEVHRHLLVRASILDNAF